MAFLEALLATSTTRHFEIEKNKLLWRSQLGYEDKEVGNDVQQWKEPYPFQSERMKPRRDLASDGRVNPKAIPCLYLATDLATAAAEVRPWVGGTVSIGQFRTTKNLKLIDFSVGHNSDFEFFPFTEPSAEKLEESIWVQVDRAFSKPITTSDSTAEYVPTQVISEFFKSNGFDGVVYKSRLGPGKNVAFYDIDSAELVTCSIIKIHGVKFELGAPEKTYHAKGKLNSPDKAR